MKIRLISPPLPNIPWQARPSWSGELVWRYDANPVIGRGAVSCGNSIFNSAVIPFGEGFAGVFRVDNHAREQRLHVGHSPDGLRWEISEEPIVFETEEPYLAKFDFGYDPRLVWIEDRFYLTWCNGAHGPTIGVAETTDFKTFRQHENAFLPFNRNGILFPRRINGRFAMLSRPSDNGHTPFGEIYYSESPDLEFWGRHRWVMGPQKTWEFVKIGGGPAPIETSEGWLIFYHGVNGTCNGYIYSVGAALLDLNEPWKVLRRCPFQIFAPAALYEQVGDVPNVTFPVSQLCDSETGRIALYYGAADTVTGLAFCHFEEIMSRLAAHPCT